MDMPDIHDAFSVLGALGALVVGHVGFKKQPPRCCSPSAQRKTGDFGTTWVDNGRCEGRSDPRCIAGNCTRCCTLHCAGKCESP